MARRAARGRGRLRRRAANQGRGGNRKAASDGLTAGVVPRVLVGAVDGVGVVAVGALELARNVLVSAVSGAASIGVEAVTATMEGTRGVVSAASQTVSDIARVAQTTVLATVDNVRHARRGGARVGGRRPLASMTAEPRETAGLARSSDVRPVGRRSTKRLRAVSRPAHPSVAA